MAKYSVTCIIRKTQRSGNDATIEMEVDAESYEEMEKIVKEEVNKKGLVFVRITKCWVPE